MNKTIKVVFEGRCMTCNGTGQLMLRVGMKNMQMECPSCGGSGKYRDSMAVVRDQIRGKVRLRNENSKTNKI